MAWTRNFPTGVVPEPRIWSTSIWSTNQFDTFTLERLAQVGQAHAACVPVEKGCADEGFELQQ